MSYHSNSSIIQHEGENWEVNVGDRGQYKICPSHLKKMITQLNIMVEKYPRVFCVVFDLHLPEYSENNAIISDLWRSLIPTIKAKYKVKDVGYCWTREQETAESQHYHCVLFLDGKQIRHSGKLRGIIASKWKSVGGSYFSQLEHPDYNIEHNDFQTKQALIYRLSYHAKQRGKGRRATQAKDYGMSRLKRK
ncbi:YagK/YfjJ domain-containing protein [Vibrio marisflavi]|uniref:YagK/YfjJ C-terminal domain-containing protein n=1 Tax=Vibrio marisflavi CECT 7928 TaxID=634439 RepID=A0ABM9A234_9VIBR|nr:inovirus-type Gp2 protein [Vibrio marisflavi]CAH0538569.1 hypothetical protein VMF7928_01491 [Vibrio marisflavi CECT 7928]